MLILYSIKYLGALSVGFKKIINLSFNLETERGKIAQVPVLDPLLHPAHLSGHRGRDQHHPLCPRHVPALLIYLSIYLSI